MSTTMVADAKIEVRMATSELAMSSWRRMMGVWKGWLF